MTDSIVSGLGRRHHFARWLGDAAGRSFSAVRPLQPDSVIGTVTYVAGDRTVDRISNQPYYQLHVEAYGLKPVVVLAYC